MIDEHHPLDDRDVRHPTHRALQDPDGDLSVFRDTFPNALVQSRVDPADVGRESGSASTVMPTQAGAG